jgi:protein-L-isoaspartate(D-aspartate) O-methyltransferase
MILVACATPDLPAPLVDELAPGGRLIIPLGRAEDEYQDLRVYERHEGEMTTRSLFPVRFVPLRTG